MELILRQYEKGKHALALQPKYESKIAMQDSLIRHLQERIVVKQQDSALLSQQVTFLWQALDYSQKADSTEKQQTAEWKRLFEQAKKAEVRARRNTVFVAIILSAVAGYFAAK